MTPEALAALHALCFRVPRPYTAQEFRDLLAQPGCFLITDPHGFALGRLVADEAELLTLAVDPDHRRAGHGTRLVIGFEAEARTRGASRAFLEVAACNRAARRLYEALGYAELGRRPGYYQPADRPPEDALILGKTLSGAPEPT